MEQKPDLTRDQVVELYELKGIAAASLNDGAEAQKAFEIMLGVDGAASLKGRYSPRVMTPFFEARSLVKEQGAISITMNPMTEGDRVRALEFTRSGLGSSLVKRLSVQVRETASGGWRKVDATFQGGKATIPVQGSSVDVTFRGLSDQDWELYSMADVKHVEAAAKPAVARKVAPPVDDNPPPTPPAVVSAAVENEPKYRPAAYTLLGVGAVGVGVGVGLMASAGALKSQFDNATVNEIGVVTGITRTDAITLQKDIATRNSVGVALISIGAASAIAGVVIFFVGVTDVPKVAVVPTQGGAFVSIGGSF